jgi:uncharacterized protein (DUF302 family)
MILTSSSASFDQTLGRLLAGIEARGLKLFAVIDHAGAARDVGLELAEERVVIFGNPKAGTLLMQADPRTGIDLPLRILVWQDGVGSAVGHQDPIELSERYGLQDAGETLAAMGALLEALVSEATEGA